ncbi:hypothetical protein HMPREF9141_0120 [Prevotella multiformis DSM 16608]|uniref:Uncharacterized protein n=1 Tax=Prevotella multiformis DSM 16608 TaxID=888743 RepID=F0F3F4_9BACT|nr:hypothetical protein HMPREF9141_0120 [Prevotella multiformis DSM 16608]
MTGTGTPAEGGKSGASCHCPACRKRLTSGLCGRELLNGGKTRQAMCQLVTDARHLGIKNGLP